MRWLVLLWLLLPTTCLADDFREVMTANGVRLLAQDWGQTKEFRATRPDLHEMNKYLGPYPSLAKVDKYFATCTAIYIVGTLKSPKWVSYTWSVAAYVIEAVAIVNNSKLKVNPEYDQKGRYANMIVFTFPI